MGSLYKKLVIISVIITILIVALVFSKTSIIKYVYHNRVFAGPSMETKRKGVLNRSINFKFSIADAEFINSFGNTISNLCDRLHTVNLDVDGEEYAVDICRFNSYFKYIDIQDVNRSLSLRFPDKHFYQGIRNFDMFQIDEIDLFEQELLYKFARKIDLLVPYTQYMKILVHNAYNGLTFLKQAYDDIFLEQNQLPHSIIFMVQRNYTDDLEIKTLYNPFTDNRQHERKVHLNNFLEQLKQEDPNLLVKYFDLDYIGRFELLRQLMEAGRGFVMEDNVKFVYNTFTGKFYPVLDESNLYNMQRGKDNGTFKVLAEQIAVNPLVEGKKRYYMLRLVRDYDELLKYYTNLKAQYVYSNKSFANKFRIQLISRYFEDVVFKKLKQYTDSKFSLKEEGTDFFLMSDRKVNPFAQRYQATRKEIGYLDNLVMKTDKIKETYHQLNLKFESDRRILLEKGTYTIRKNVTIPMGYTLFIAAGTTIRMAPGISFISYSPLHIRGTRESPVKIEALSSDKPFGVWAVNGSGDELNTVEYLDFSGGKSAFLSGSFYPGGLNFHNTNLEMKYSTLHHTHGHDGLSVKKGRVLLEFNHFHSNSTDHAALDYCRGVIRKNRFLDDSEDREGDAVDLSNSVFFVSHNLFAYFIDKGVSAGENSRCFLYKNTIRQNYIGVASKNHAYVMAMDNKFYDNSRGVAAYRKDQMYGGGFVYLMGNDFRINDQLYKVDKDSAVFTLSPDEYKAEFTRLIKAGKHDDLFTLFNEIIDRFKFNRVRIESFRVGNLEAEVDERNKIVFAALPTGADTTQDITCRTAQNDVAVYMKPVFYGNKKVSRDAGREQQMKAGEPYDFKDYVFYGKILLKRKSYLTEYDIYVTTGTLPIIEIDTSGEHGVPRVIKNEPRIPCKIRIFSLDKSARKKNASKDYTNTILDAEIEGRGKKLPKWKYGIELDKSFPLEGMNDSRKWVLESSFIEKSLMRNKVAFDLLEQFRLSASKQKIAVRSHFVEVILNGSYNGVYILMEHVNKSFIGLEEYDVNKEFNALMYRARNINANFMKSNFRPFYGKRYKKIPVGVQPLEKAADPIYGWHSGFEQRYPQKRKYGEHWRPLERFTRFVALATDSEFKQHIFYMLDRESYIDLWLFTLMVDDSDGLYKNRYIARHRGKDARWHIIPWDKDGIMGRMHDMSKRPHNLMLETHLFKRCLNVPYFVETFKLKWERLKGANIISTDNIYKMIDRNIRMLADAQKRNFLRWPVDYYRYPDKNNFEQEIAYTKEWIRERILFLDQQIEGIGEDATQ